MTLESFLSNFRGSHNYSIDLGRFLIGLGPRCIIYDGGGRISLDGMAARGHVNGWGPSLAMGGTKSELVPTKPSQNYPTTPYYSYYHIEV